MVDRVAIAYICTGPYVKFWKDFFESYEDLFLPHCEKHYFVFTDAVEVFAEATCDRVHRIDVEAKPWPFSTLLRFSIILGAENQLATFDFVFFMNANLICTRPVTEAALLPRTDRGENLVVVRHPGFHDASPATYTYERDPRSLAFIPRSEGDIYVCGGINGGTAAAFLDLMRELEGRVARDLDNGIIAIWHDESHLNRYVVGRDDVRVLSPSFCFPIGWDGPFEPIISLRPKTGVIDEASIKGWPQNQPPGLLRRLHRSLRSGVEHGRQQRARRDLDNRAVDGG